LNNYKNVEAGTAGRILSYNDLSDRPMYGQRDENDNDFEEEIEERKRQEEEEKRKAEEEMRNEEERLEQEAEEERIKQEELEIERVTQL
jgi:hypothetical protein